MSFFHGSESNIVRKSQLILQQTRAGALASLAIPSGVDGEAIRSGIRSRVKVETQEGQRRIAPRG